MELVLVLVWILIAFALGVFVGRIYEYVRNKHKVQAALDAAEDVIRRSGGVM